MFPCLSLLFYTSEHLLEKVCNYVIDECLCVKLPLQNIHRTRYTDSHTGCFFIHKCLIGLVPSYLCVYMAANKCNYGLRSRDVLQMLAPRARTELGKKAFK